MADNGTGLEPNDTTTNTDPAAGENPEPTSGDPSVGENESPLWEGIADDHPVRAEVTKLRNEAASKRNAHKDAQAENLKLQADLQAATTKEDLDRIVAEHVEKTSAAESKLARVLIGNEFGLPATLADRLQGATEEELREDAKAVAALLGGREPQLDPLDPAGGRTPRTSEPTASSLAASIRANRR